MADDPVGGEQLKGASFELVQAISEPPAIVIEHKQTDCGPSRPRQRGITPLRSAWPVGPTSHRLIPVPLSSEGARPPNAASPALAALNPRLERQHRDVIQIAR